MEKLKLRQLANNAKKMEKDIVALRRHFHMYPELGGKEVRTAAKIVKELQKLDLRIETKIGGTGVVGYIEKKNLRSKKKYVASTASLI